MVIYEFEGQDYNEVLDMAEDLKEMASNLVKCLDKAKEVDDGQGVKLRRGVSRNNIPRMRSNSSNMPRMRRGYVVRPEEDDYAFNERYNW